MRAQRSELFSLCVVYCVCSVRLKCPTSTGLAGQPNGCWMLLAVCWCALVCVGVCWCIVGVCVYVGVCWCVCWCVRVLVCVSVCWCVLVCALRRAPPEDPPPGRPSVFVGRGPTAVCVKKTPTSVRWKTYMEKVCNGFLTSIEGLVSDRRDENGVESTMVR